jgi:hypothetical protein
MRPCAIVVGGFVSKCKLLCAPAFFMPDSNTETVTKIA